MGNISKKVAAYGQFVLVLIVNGETKSLRWTDFQTDTAVNDRHSLGKPQNKKRKFFEALN